MMCRLLIKKKLLSTFKNDKSNRAMRFHYWEATFRRAGRTNKALFHNLKGFILMVMGAGLLSTLLLRSRAGKQVNVISIRQSQFFISRAAQIKRGFSYHN
jgi:hypothetical protein